MATTNCYLLHNSIGIGLAAGDFLNLRISSAKVVRKSDGLQPFSKLLFGKI